MTYTDSTFGESQITSLPHGPDKLFSVLLMLLKKQQFSPWQLRRLYDELDTTILAPGQHERISPLLADGISQLCASSDALQILDWHRPKLEPEPMEASNKRMDRWVPLLGQFQANSINAQKAGLVAAAFPATKFLYPTGPKTDEWAQNSAAVDDAFTKFWEIAKAFMPENFGQEIFDLGEDLFKKSPRRFTNWTELTKRDRSDPSRPPTDASAPTAGPDPDVADVESVTVVPSLTKDNVQGLSSLHRKTHEANPPRHSSSETHLSPCALFESVFRVVSCRVRRLLSFPYDVTKLVDITGMTIILA